MKSLTFADYSAGTILFLVLVFLLFQFLDEEREMSRRQLNANRIRQIAAAFHQYADVYGVLPPAWTRDKTGRRLHSWRVLLLPYLGEGEHYQRIRLNEPWDSPWNLQFHDDCPAVYSGSDWSVLPFAKERGASCRGMSGFSVVTGAETLFPDDEEVRWEDITDGLSQTLLLMENREPVPWMSPWGDPAYETVCEGFDAASSRFQRGILIGLADGSVRFLDESLDAEVWQRLLVRGDAKKAEKKH